MEDKIKNIVATYIRVPAEQISSETIIDRSSVGSSISLHRMYAKLAQEGIVVEDYWSIKKFSNLLEKAGNNGKSALSAIQPIESASIAVPVNHYGTGTGVGIDIEEIEAMPKVSDFREHEFYKMNFSSTEIAYCILQPAPYASFAGLFAAKEAIVKADNSNRSKPFNTIVINHNPEGKPEYPGFYLSVSHTNNVSVAVALQIGVDPVKHMNDRQVETPAVGGNANWLVILTLLISLAALIISLLK